MSTSEKKLSGRISIGLNPHGQDAAKVQSIVEQALGLAGCARCGRLAFLDFRFGPDPAPEFTHLGAVSVDNELR
jgi:hypothetical protein